MSKEISIQPQSREAIKLNNSDRLKYSVLPPDHKANEPKKTGWYSNLSPVQQKFVSWSFIGLGVSAVLGTMIYLGTRRVKKVIANREESKSAGGSEYATWAKNIRNAFDNNGWWGTDEVLLRNIIREVPSYEDWTKVKKSYTKMYEGANLITEMTKELKSTEYSEMIAIIKSKPRKKKDVVEGAKMFDPTGWAKRINAALSYNFMGLFWGTDEDAVKAVFIEMPTHRAYWATKKVYYKMYGVNMYNDMLSDMDDIKSYLKIIWRKPKGY